MLVGVACGKDSKKDASSGSSTTTKEDIKIGAIFDLSGATADVGTPYSEGIKDYVEYKNAAGGVEGHKLALKWQDFGYKVPQAEQLYQQYVSEGSKVFMGWGTADTEALRPRVTADKIPFMSASYAETLADPKVTPFNFFPGASYSQQMRIALQYIADQNAKKHVEVAVFHNDSPFGTSPLEDGKKYIADKKLDIGFKNYPMPAGATDYVAQIGQAKSQGAKYIIIQNVSSPASKLATNLAAQKSTAQIMCLNWCADELFIKLAGPAAEKMIGVMPFSPPVAGVAGLETINDFLKAKNTDASAKGLHYVQGWYTMASMTEGIANALKANGDKVDGDSIKAGLEKISDFKTGVSDPITFSSDYHAGLKSAPLFQVEGGVFKKIQDPKTIEK
ncbi:MAG TPA: ABC transporter substrate-binding protein [Acidimicrobiia bacterium]|jgi:branched-chain amino acid transport system substrate-binding protein|nr:ABC transporter substrate-binding protein [Acidimicrobiia bacterium]